MFCPKCGSILIPKKDRNKQVLACKCGYKNTEESDMKFKEVITPHKEVEVIEEQKEALPIVEEECPKCKHKQAYSWELQTRAADEPPTQFFRCEKCRHTWRHY
jgi:transcription factor S